VQIIKSTDTALQKSKNIKLSIQFSLDGFSFCIQDASSNKKLAFFEYAFDKELTSPEKLLKEIIKIFESNSALQKDFSSILVIHQNNLYTLVPQIYFKEEQLSNYLAFTIKTLKTDFITFDVISTFNNVYIPYVNINNYLFQHFGEFTYQHHISCIIQKLIAQNKSKEINVYINVYSTSFDIVVLQEKKVLLSNSFSYLSKEDFIYYILFVYEELKLDKEVTPIYFMGKIKKDSNLYSITYNYVRHIFFKKSDDLLFNKLDSENHEYYILLG